MNASFSSFFSRCLHPGCLAGGDRWRFDPRRTRLIAERRASLIQPNSARRHWPHSASSNGVTKDKMEAVRYFRLTGDQANAYARRRLGLCLKAGQGVAKDVAEATAYLRLAAEPGVR